jgi:hypothetical protein
MQQPNGRLKIYADGFNNNSSNNFDDASSIALLAAAVYHLALLTGNKTFIPKQNGHAQPLRHNQQFRLVTLIPPLLLLLLLFSISIIRIRAHTTLHNRRLALSSRRPLNVGSEGLLSPETGIFCGTDFQCA